MFYQTQTARRPQKWLKNAVFLFLVTLTFDLETRPNETPNRSSVWIWHKSVQQLRGYFTHKQKTTDWRRHKQNLPQFTACGNNKNLAQDVCKKSKSWWVAEDYSVDPVIVQTQV